MSTFTFEIKNEDILLDLIRLTFHTVTGPDPKHNLYLMEYLKCMRNKNPEEREEGLKKIEKYLYLLSQSSE